MNYEEKITDREAIEEGIEDFRQEQIREMSEVIPKHYAERRADKDVKSKFRLTTY